MKQPNIDNVKQQAIDSFLSFAGERSHLESIQLLQGGQSGVAVFLIRYLENHLHKYVVARVLPLSDAASREFLCAKHAADIGVSPTILWPDKLDCDHQVVLSEYISGPNLSATDLLTYQDTLLTLLKRIHTQLPKNGLTQASTLFERILRLADLDKMSWFNSSFRSQVETLQHKMANFKMSPIVVTHNDFNPGNFKFKDEKSDEIVVFDWGNAGLGDPIADLADFSSLCGFDTRMSLALLGQYLERPSDMREQAYFLIYKAISILRIAAAAIRDYHKYASHDQPFKMAETNLTFDDWYQGVRQNKRHFPANKDKDWYDLANSALYTWHVYAKQIPSWLKQLEAS